MSRTDVYLAVDGVYYACGAAVDRGDGPPTVEDVENYVGGIDPDIRPHVAGMITDVYAEERERKARRDKFIERVATLRTLAP
jgi:hypothetical protein